MRQSIMGFVVGIARAWVCSLPPTSSTASSLPRSDPLSLPHRRQPRPGGNRSPDRLLRGRPPMRHFLPISDTLWTRSRPCRCRSARASSRTPSRSPAPPPASPCRRPTAARSPLHAGPGPPAAAPRPAVLIHRRRRASPCAIRHDRGARVPRARASELFPCSPTTRRRAVLSRRPEPGVGFLCQPLAGAPDGAAERLSVLLNQDWPTDTLVQVLLWASPDLESRSRGCAACASTAPTRCCARRPRSARRSCARASPAARPGQRPAGARSRRARDGKTAARRGAAVVAERRTGAELRATCTRCSRPRASRPRP